MLSIFFFCFPSPLWNWWDPASSRLMRPGFKIDGTQLQDWWDLSLTKIDGTWQVDLNPQPPEQQLLQRKAASLHEHKQDISSGSSKKTEIAVFYYIGLDISVTDVAKTRQKFCILYPHYRYVHFGHIGRSPGLSVVFWLYRTLRDRLPIGHFIAIKPMGPG
jgi:hypothetical protein